MIRSWQLAGLGLAVAVAAIVGCRAERDRDPAGTGSASAVASSPTASAAPAAAGSAPTASASSAPAAAENPWKYNRPLRPARGLTVDNSRCFVCHLNYAKEPMSVQHARANIGCEHCHGPSDEHCADENNVTPPDLLFTKAKGDASCLKCHPEEKLFTAEVPCPYTVLEPGMPRHCTDCHGEHRMAVRQVRWNPETGEILPEGAAAD